MSRTNGDKARVAVQKRHLAKMRAKLRLAKAAAGAAPAKEAKPAKPAKTAKPAKAAKPAAAAAKE